MSNSTEFLEELSSTTVSLAAVSGALSARSWGKAAAVTELVEEFGVVSVTISHPTAATIAAVLNGIERLVADVFAGYALADPRWQIVRPVYFEWIADLVREKDLHQRILLATMLRAELDVVMVEASMSSPFRFSAKVFASPRLKRLIHEWGVKPAIFAAVLDVLIAAQLGDPAAKAKQDPPPPPQAVSCTIEEAGRVAKDIERTMQASGEVIIETENCKVTIKKGPPPSESPRRQQTQRPRR